MNTIDKYLFQAMDHYPYSLEETTESLAYALSYDDKNTMALCLAGRIQAEQLLDYEKAKAYFEQALTVNLYALEVYPFYIRTLVLNGDYDQAEKLIDFALTVKGINATAILFRKVFLHETKQEFKLAQKTLKQIKLCVVNTWDNDYADECDKRLAAKLELSKGKKRKKRKTKK